MRYIWLFAFTLSLCATGYAQECLPPCASHTSNMVELTASHLRTHSYSSPITIQREAKSLPTSSAVSFNPNLKDQDEALHTQRLVFQREKDVEEGALTANPNLIRQLVIDAGDLHYFMYNNEVLLRGHVRAFYTRAP